MLYCCKVQNNNNNNNNNVHTLYKMYMFLCKNVHFISCAGHQLYERGVDLEVEGVRYIEIHRGPAAYVLGPPP